MDVVGVADDVARAIGAFDLQHERQLDGHALFQRRLLDLEAGRTLLVHDDLVAVDFDVHLELRVVRVVVAVAFVTAGTMGVVMAMVFVRAMRVTVVLLVAVLRFVVLATLLVGVMGVMRMFRAVGTMTVVMLVFGVHVVLRMVVMRLVLLVRAAVVVALAVWVTGVLALTSRKWLSFLHGCSFDNLTAFEQSLGPRLAVA